MCLISQDGMVTREELFLDEGMYSDVLPTSYPPYVYTGHRSWGQNANYYLAKVSVTVSPTSDNSHTYTVS